MSLRFFKVTAVERINDGKLNHPEMDHDVDGIRWREGGGREELWNELVCSTHSLHRLPVPLMVE